MPIGQTAYSQFKAFISTKNSLVRNTEMNTKTAHHTKAFIVWDKYPIIKWRVFEILQRTFGSIYSSWKSLNCMLRQFSSTATNNQKR